MNRLFFGMVAIVAVLGCRAARDSQYDEQPPTPRIQPMILQYVDTDGFDALFEASLVSQDPVIIVRTDNEKPDWEHRLNAWIAAWNMGGKAEHRVIRGQVPLPAQIDAEFLREFRLLVFGGVDRAEELAKAGSAWWHEDRTRSRRVALLRRYNLRFHVREDRRIDLIFFNGDYAGKYREFMTTPIGAEEKDWSRTIECSISGKMQESSRTHPMPNPRAILEFSEHRE
jgi:hypothetical protein